MPPDSKLRLHEIGGYHLRDDVDKKEAVELGINACDLALFYEKLGVQLLSMYSNGLKYMARIG